MARFGFGPFLVVTTFTFSIGFTVGLAGCSASSTDAPHREPAHVSGALTGSDAADDIFEENDSYDDAKEVSCDTRYTLWAEPADRDFFFFSPAAGTRIALALHAAHNADLDLYVTDGPSLVTDVVARAASQTGDEAVAFVASGQRLTLVVDPYFDVEAGLASADQYDLTIGCETRGDDVALPTVADSAASWGPRAAR